MNKLTENLKNDLINLCSQVGFDPKPENDLFLIAFHKLVQDQFHQISIHRICNLLLNAVYLLKHLSFEIGTAENINSIHCKNLTNIEHELKAIKNKIEHEVTYYIKNFHLQTKDGFIDEFNFFNHSTRDSHAEHDDYFAKLIAISKLIGFDSNPTMYLQEIPIQPKMSNRPKTSSNSKIGYYILGMIFDELLASTKNFKIEIPKHLKQYLDEDTNKEERKVSSSILVLLLLDFIGSPRTERSIREQLRINKSEAQSELGIIKNRKITSIDELIQNFEKSPPGSIFKITSDHQSDLIDEIKSSILSEANILKSRIL